MDNLHMNRNLGTKWFTFYTKVRPWLSLITAFSVVREFLQFTEIYTSYWWLFLYVAVTVLQVVLSIMVFVKSSGDYLNFVSFVKGVLVFEIVGIAYSQGVVQYIQNGFNLGYAFASAAVVLTVLYFVWYRLNIKYFEKRILKDCCETDTYKEDTFTAQTGSTESESSGYCRMCGSKLTAGSKFCSSCGAEIK